MSLLVEMFRNQVKKEKDIRKKSEAAASVGYSTGFHTVDMTNAYIVHVRNKEKDLDYNYISAGIPDGSMVQLIGRSQSGKSTFATQIAANICRPFKTSCIFEDTIERGMTWPRRIQLTGWSEEEIRTRIIPRDKGITIENFYERIKDIYDIKMANPDKFMYDTGLLDNFGEPIQLFEPTVYILDSLPMLMPEKYAADSTSKDAEELPGPMSTTAGAKAVTQTMRSIIPMLTSANIILLVINHILPNVQTGIVHKQSQLPWLSPDERLPKGETNVLLANCIIRFKDHDNMSGDDKYKEAGKLVDIYFEKSRSGIPHRKQTLVYTFDHGYDNLLSLLYFLQQTDRINGAGVGLYLDDRSDLKFSMGTFKKKFNENPEFQDLFLKVAFEELSKIPKMAKESVTQNSEFNDKLNQLCMNYRPSAEANGVDI